MNTLKLVAILFYLTSCPTFGAYGGGTGEAGHIGGSGNDKSIKPIVEIVLDEK